MSGEHGPEQVETATERFERVPHVYVADLAAYNNGELHGAWIDATQEPEAMWEQINAMLARSPIPGAEEIAIHDYQNFGPLRLSEYESINTVAKIARGFVEHGRAFLHWVAYRGTSDTDAVEDFEDNFLGHYTSYEEMGEELADAATIEQLLDEHLPGHIRSFVTVDYESYGEHIGSGMHVAQDEDGIYVFNP
jgi:antirestriction protein